MTYKRSGIPLSTTYNNMALWYEYYIKRFSFSGNSSIKIFLSEFIGMSMFVLIGSNQAFTTTDSESNYMTINLRLALGYTFGLCMCIENGGFLNPAIAIVFKVLGKMKWKELFANILAQFLGALFGAILIYGISYDGTKRPEDATKSCWSEARWYEAVACYTTSWSISAIFGLGTSQSIEDPSIQTFFVKSGLLMMGVMSIIDERSVNPPRYVQPFMIGTILFSVGLTTNHSTYCFLNLAQDISPRIVAAIFCNCKDYWKPYDHIQSFLGPIAGAFAGALIYILFVEIHHKEYESVDECDSDSAFGDDEITAAREDETEKHETGEENRKDKRE